MRKFKNFAFDLAAISALAVPALAFGQAIGDAPPISSLGDVSGSVTNIVNWMIGLFWVLTVAFVIWAAFLYLTAGGDEDKVKEAKSRVVYALIAGAVALLATGLKAIVGNLLTGTT